MMSAVVVLPPIVLITVLFVKADPRPREKPQSGKGANRPPSDLTEVSNSKQSNDNSKNAAGQKKRRYWPHWCRYLAWGLTVLAITAAGAFTILYSMQFKKEKSRDWLIAFFLSFAESVLLLQPVKVCVSSQ